MMLTSHSFNKNLLITVLLVLSSVKWSSEITIQSPYHFGLTQLCRSVFGILENSVYKNMMISGDTDLRFICSGPGGKPDTNLPLNKTAADELIALKILDPEATTVVMVHGYNDDPTAEVPYAITDAYLKTSSYNILQLDSGKVIIGDYFKSLRASWQIGDIAAKFLAYLCSAGVTKPSKIHLIGLSLGAHIASCIGKAFKKQTGHKVGRITGLDPAATCYDYHVDKLTKKDADYVDIIHANQGVEGIIELTGHSDFFINGGGPNQPGCLNPTCSHKRAGFLYADSISSDRKPFYARKCDSLFDFRAGLCDNNEVTIMGYNSSAKTRGFYYLNTANEPPYSMGMEGTKSGSNKLFYRVLSEMTKVVKNMVND